MIYALYPCIAQVNINNDGIPWMCNDYPNNKQSIEPLSINDQNLINKLEQVQVVHRHGARTGAVPISTFLPDANLEYDCNISSVVTRQYKDNDYYTNSSKSMFNLRKIYVADEQTIEGNCQFMQSLQYLIPQQQANARHIKNAYIGNQSYHLFDKSTLNDIADNLEMYAEDERITLTTTDYERTIASLSVISSELFFPNSNIGDIIMNANTHDQGSDPYLNYDDCQEADQFIEWTDQFKSDSLLTTGNICNILSSSLFAKKKEKKIIVIYK